MFKFFRAAITRARVPVFLTTLVLFKGFHSPIQCSFTKKAELDEKFLDQKKKRLSFFAKEDEKFRQNLNEGIALFQKGQLEEAQDIFLMPLRISDMTDGNINHGSGIASYYLGVIHQAKGEHFISSKNC